MRRYKQSLIERGGRHRQMPNVSVHLQDTSLCLFCGGRMMRGRRACEKDYCFCCGRRRDGSQHRPALATA